MAPASPAHVSQNSGSLTWRPTKIMNMRDLSKDDDFLSHLLVEKLGTGTVPLLVHKMDSSRRLPKTDPQLLMQIVRRLVITKGPIQHVIRQAVDELLKMPPIRYYLKSYTQKQINAFSTHASRYLELYHPSGSIEIAHTSRYTHRTGKSELCILATRPLPVGTVITELKGSMANLTDEEDKELKRTDLRNSDIRRDFSVIHSKQMKKNHLFLGPARFVNHDCDNNCELFREGKYITFRVLRPIAIGEEITAHYGDGYFGRRNRHCLCETCEKNGRGGYAPENSDEELEPDSDSSSDSDSDSDTSSSDTESDVEDKPALNVNERRTRRGVYATITKDDDSDESEDEEDNKVPLADAQDIPTDGEIEMTTEVDTASELASLTPSVPPSEAQVPRSSSRPLSTPVRDVGISSRSSSSLTSLSSSAKSTTTPQTSQSTPFRSIISTRHQKASLAQATASNTPDLEKSATPSQGENANDGTPSTPIKRVTRSVSTLMLSGKQSSGKGKEKASSTPASTPRSQKKTIDVGNDEVKVKKEEVENRLRTRPGTSVSVAETSKDPAPQSDIPRGVDGKPLPMCSTCRNVLPVISVDSQVVWGLGLETSKKKKPVQECPRCIRHFAIYGQAWPRRVAPNGSAFLTTPREEMTPLDISVSTRKVTHKALPVLDRKLAAAASASVSAHKRPSHEKKGERPVKRRKTEPVPPRIETPSKSKKAEASTKDEPGPPEEPVKRKRGRPRLSSPRLKGKAPPPVKVEDGDGSRPIHIQPRNTNGRFGKKDKAMKREKAKEREKERQREREKEREVAANAPDGVSARDERAKAKAIRNGEDEAAFQTTRISPRSKKRENEDANEQEDGSPRKKASLSREGEVQRVLPRPASGFRGGRLVSNPNPLRFALHAWAGPVVLDESSSEDEKGPVTPEDEQSPPATDIAASEETIELPLFVPLPSLPRGPLTVKPSPFTYAKRRWAPPTMVASVDNDQLDGGVKEAVPDLAASKKASISIDRPYQWAGANSSLSDGETYGISATGHMSPISAGSPSELSSEDELVSELKNRFPVVTADSVKLHPASNFIALPTSPPHLINAGWDTDTSDV